MKKLLDTFRSEGFVTDAWQYDDGSVDVIADGDIDADGANGQNGARPAYTIRDDGSEYLKNGGMKRSGDHIVFTSSWGKDVVITQGGQPKVFPGGVLASKTAYRFKGKDADDPAAYVDAETVPFIVVQETIRRRAKGVVLGCACEVIDIRNGRMVKGVVADIGPLYKIGELSIAAAREIGIPSSPRSGGTELRVLKYRLYPDIPAQVAGITFDLIPM